MNELLKSHPLKKVLFLPLKISVEIPEGKLISDAMTVGGIVLPFDCGGTGRCGRCLVLAKTNLSPATESEINTLTKGQLEKGWRLSCQARIKGDVQVLIPTTSETAESAWDVAKDDIRSIKSDKPVVISTTHDITPPSLADPRSDLSRVLQAVKEKKAIPHLVTDFQTASSITVTARDLGWKLKTILRNNQLIGVLHTAQNALGLAVDLGSTKLAAYLVDLEDGQVLASKGVVNPQISIGADVITRIQRAIAHPQDCQQLTVLVRRALNKLLDDMLQTVGAKRQQICEMCLVGNSAMTHLLLGLPVAQMAAPPFVACLDQAIDVKTREIDIAAAPGAYLHLPPQIGGFIGSDCVAMIMGTDLDQPGPCRLGLDIGTNTELVLTVPDNKHQLFVGSAPSGPTFEGAHLTSGMRATAGAISHVQISNNEIYYSTIDDAPPAGICGSGIIDTIAEMLREGIINAQGHLNTSRPQVKKHGDTFSFILVPAAESATGEDLVISQSDIGQVQLAKASIGAAVYTLIDLAELEPSALTSVVLAGSFGNHINMKNAKLIGLIPDIATAEYSQVGNAAGIGAQLMLNNQDMRRRSQEIPAMSQYVELSNIPIYKFLYARNLRF